MIGIKVDRRRQPAARPPRLDLESKGRRRLQGIDNVHVMRPGFREILPGMHGGVHADEIFLPVGWGALAVMALERLVIILPVIAEQSPKTWQDSGVRGHQPVPEIVPDLVAKMSQQSTIRL